MSAEGEMHRHMQLDEYLREEMMNEDSSDEEDAREALEAHDGDMEDGMWGEEEEEEEGEGDEEGMEEQVDEGDDAGEREEEHGDVFRALNHRLFAAGVPAEVQEEVQARNRRLWNMRARFGGLPDFVRMLIPNQQGTAPERRTNETLIRQLKRNASISCKKVEQAFRVCARDVFVPEDQKQEAFYDHPLRLDTDFNISAPHMHACMVQGLDVQEGDHILDIGSGCGATTAIFAYLTGSTGAVVGVELRESALELAHTAMETMKQNREYTQRACEVKFQQGNAFILPEHEHKYDKVHVGGLCDTKKIPALLRLLKPGTGCIVVPAGAELLCLKQVGDKIERSILAHVRFGELEVPTDAEIVFGHLDAHRRRAMEPESLASSFEEQMATLVGGGLEEEAASALGKPGGGKSSEPLDVRNGGARPSTSSDDSLEVHSLCTCGSLGFSPGSLSSFRLRKPSSSQERVSTDSFAVGSPSDPDGTLVVRSSTDPPSTSSPEGRSSLDTLSCAAHALMLPTRPRTLPAALVAIEAELGPADARVCGEGFEVAVHSVVLRARCPLVRAQEESGMRDAEARAVTLPSHFTERAVTVAVEYMYTDTATLDEECALPALAVAVYFDMPHLVSLASAYIVNHLQSLAPEDAVDATAQLHVFAGEHGLASLSRFCAAFLAMHVRAARAAPSYAALGPRQLDEVLEALASERELLVERLTSLSCELDAAHAETAL